MRHATRSLILAILLGILWLAAAPVSGVAAALEGADSSEVVSEPLVRFPPSRSKTYGKAFAEAERAREAALRKARRAAARERRARRIVLETARYSRLYGSRVGRWYVLVHRYFPGREDAALYVMRGESGGNPAATNGICNGLFQLHRCHAVRFRAVTGRSYYPGVYVARANIRFAAYMSRQGRDWSAWVVRPP